jgi:uncharacterized membrane protein (DUF2068 family)
MNASNTKLLRLIAVFKVLKAFLLIVIGAGVLRLMHSDVAGVLEHWVLRLGLDPGNHYVEHALAKAANLSPHRIRELGLVSFVYAALFMTEGVGLWLLKRWAEWFTVILTASLLPLEAYELHQHPTIAKILILMLNLAIVAYLAWRIRSDPSQASPPQA